MNKRIAFVTLASALVFSLVMADESGVTRTVGGGRSTTIITTGRAETGLLGIKLYDSGVRVVTVFGSPDDIQAVGVGGGTIGPTGGGGAPGGPSAAGASGGGGGGGGGSAMTPQINRPWSFGDEMLRFQGPLQPTAAGAAGGGGGQGGPTAPTAAGAGGGGQGGAAGGQQGQEIIFTRWIYNMGASRYGFVLNRFNQVVQIEAIGTADSRVRTNRGIRFGSNFAQIIRSYGDPDGYEISGDTIVVRYLTTHKVAFRLNRLSPNQPHVVTGVVVAGGKA